MKLEVGKIVRNLKYNIICVISKDEDGKRGRAIPLEPFHTSEFYIYTYDMEEIEDYKLTEFNMPMILDINQINLKDLKKLLTELADHCSAGPLGREMKALCESNIRRTDNMIRDMFEKN